MVPLSRLESYFFRAGPQANNIAVHEARGVYLSTLPFLSWERDMLRHALYPSGIHRNSISLVNGEGGEKLQYR